MAGTSPQIDDYELPPGIEPTCPQCHYDLRASTNFSGARCPECGATLPFDKLKFKRDRAAERRYRKPFRIDDWMPIHWSLYELIALAIVICVTISVVLRFTVGRSQFHVATVLIVAELILAYYVIRWRRHWQLRRYERQRQKGSRINRSEDNSGK